MLLVAAGVLTLLFQRAEGKAFHLPGGDGLVITIAGFWTCALIVWRIFDKQGGTASGQNVISYGIEWGIFVALGVAASLAYAGSRIRAAHRPEPPLPGEDEPPRGGWAAPQEPGPIAPEGRARGRRRDRRRPGRAPGTPASGRRSRTRRARTSVVPRSQRPEVPRNQRPSPECRPDERPGLSARAPTSLKRAPGRLADRATEPRGAA